MTTYTVGDAAQETIRQAVALALQLPDYTGADGATVMKAVEWSDRETSQGSVGDVYARLHMGYIVPIQRPETRTEFVDGGTPQDSYQIVRVGGHCAVGVSVHIFSRTQDPTKAALGRVAGLLRTRLWIDAVQDILVAGNVSLSMVHPQIDDSWWNTGRKESKAVCDLVFLATEYDESGDVSNGYVASLGGTGTFEDGAQGDIEAVLEQDDTTPP